MRAQLIAVIFPASVKLISPSLSVSNLCTRYVLKDAFPIGMLPLRGVYVTPASISGIEPKTERLAVISRVFS